VSRWLRSPPVGITFYLLARKLGSPGQFLQSASQNHTPSFLLTETQLPTTVSVNGYLENRPSVPRPNVQVDRAVQGT